MVCSLTLLGSSSRVLPHERTVDISSTRTPDQHRWLFPRAPLRFRRHAAQELAELGGGGHETICASVQEHIADTYLGHGGGQGALPGPGGSKSAGEDRTVESSRGRPSREQGTLAGAAAAGDVGPAPGGREGSRRSPWTVDAEGGVWTSPPPLRPPSVAGKGPKKDKRRGDVQGKSGAGRKNAPLGDEFEGVGKGGGSHPGSVRLGGGGGDGDDVAASGGAVGFAEMDKNAEREREENLDKAQVTLCRQFVAPVLIVAPRAESMMHSSLG